MVSNRMHIERAIFRGRAEVRYAMHRERQSAQSAGNGSTNGMGLTGVGALSANAYNNNEPMSQVPIESDADAGFASRTRKMRAARAEAHARQGHGHGHGHGHEGRRSLPPSAIGGSYNSASVPEMLLRRRKGSRRTAEPEGLPSSSAQGTDAGAGRLGESIRPAVDVPRIDITPGADDMTPRPSSYNLAQATPTDPPPRYGIVNLGQTFRHYRTSSLSAFPTFPSFRRSQGTVQDEPNAIEESEDTSGTDIDTDRTPRPSSLSLGTTAARNHRHQSNSNAQSVSPSASVGSGTLSAHPHGNRRSQRSITSWFRSNESSSESDDDYVGQDIDVASEDDGRYERGLGLYGPQESQEEAEREREDDHEVDVIVAAEQSQGRV